MLERTLAVIIMFLFLFYSFIDKNTHTHSANRMQQPKCCVPEMSTHTLHAFITNNWNSSVTLPSFRRVHHGDPAVVRVGDGSSDFTSAGRSGGWSWRGNCSLSPDLTTECKLVFIHFSHVGSLLLPVSLLYCYYYYY